MRTKELEYTLPKKLIAAYPESPRDAARLLAFNKKNRKIEHSRFRNLADFLNPRDVLVFNNTKVFPARVFATKETGGKIEVIFLSEKSTKIWEVLIGGKVYVQQKIFFSKKMNAEILSKDKIVKIKVNLARKYVFSELEKIGKAPLPPYIKRSAKEKDKKDYQTVYAKKFGSAAAPTAGMHFTKKLIEKLKKKGVQVEYVTLHVGLGTFAPIKTEVIEGHQIHREYFEIDKNTAARLHRAKKEGSRIIAVGTTSLRALESSAEILHSARPRRVEAETSLYIYSGYKFKFVNGLITNFHTPRSSLLALVYAFAGKKNVENLYKEAIKESYRFFSYGDGMMIL